MYFNDVSMQLSSPSGSTVLAFFVKMFSLAQNKMQPYRFALGSLASVAPSLALYGILKHHEFYC